MKNPLVSFLIPSYNHEKYINQCLESILSQTYDNFEIIIVDDCSKDSSVEKIRAYSEHDSRIRFSTNSFNRGMNGTLNEAFKKSTGKYVIFLSSDDFLASDYLEKMVTRIEGEKNCAVLYPVLRSVDDNGKEITSPQKPNVPLQEAHNGKMDKFAVLRRLFFVGNFLTSPGMMISREYCTHVFPLASGVQQLQDFIMHINLLFNGNCAFLGERVINYRVPTDSNDHVSSNDVKAFKRIELEFPYALDIFLRNITSVDVLNAVFGEKAARYGNPTKETIPFIVARLALDESENRLLTLWGFRTLVSFLSTGNNQELVHTLYGFDFAQFSKLSNNVHTVDYYLQKQATDFTDSASWKITAPLRAASSFIKNMKKR